MFKDQPGKLEKIDPETLEGLEPVSALSAGRIDELAQQTYVEVVPAQKCLFIEGDSDRKLVYLLNGEIELRSSASPEVKTVTAGMPETWHPIANKQPRQVTAVTLSDVEVIRIDMDQFDQMLTWDQMALAEAEDEANETAIIRIEGDWRTKLRNNLAFQEIPPTNIEELFERMEPVEVSVGDVIIKQGDPGDYFYLIDKGSAKVTRQMQGQEKPVTLAELGEGTCFGEEALISDNPRNANVIMISEGRLMRLAKTDFEHLLKKPLLTEIGFADAMDEVETGAVFLDVRVMSEFTQGHLPGSINIPLHELRHRIDELEKNTYYICYCSTGRRSSAASFILSQQGFKSSVLNQGIEIVPGAFLIK